MGGAFLSLVAAANRSTTATKPQLVERIPRLLAQRLTGLAIAERLRLPDRIITQAGRGRLEAQGATAGSRYPREELGELAHIDTYGVGSFCRHGASRPRQSIEGRPTARARKGPPARRQR